MARVELLKAKVTQCFKCWRFGHTVGVCQSVTDMRGFCFRCGQNGHQVRECKNEYSCYPCREVGYCANHRMGGYLCQVAGIARKSSVNRE